jgi:hypothetical protein
LCSKDPDSGAHVKTALLLAPQRITIERSKHAAAYQRMTEEFESAQKLLTKYEALVKGYVQRDVSLGEQLQQKTAELARKELEAQGLEVWHMNLSFASPCRLAVHSACGWRCWLMAHTGIAAQHSIATVPLEQVAQRPVRL